MLFLDSGRVAVQIPRGGAAVVRLLLVAVMTAGWQVRAADGGNSRPLVPERPRRQRRRQWHPNGSATAITSLGKGNDDGEGRLLFPPLPCRCHFCRILCVTAAARRRDDSATIVATVASELFVHDVPSQCCVASTMLRTGKPVGVLKNLVTLEFWTNPIRLGPKTRFFWDFLAALSERDLGQPQIF